MLNKSVAIIGAGLSAAVCAKSLNGLVKNISIFEQSEFIGGRLYLTEELSTTPSFTVSTPFFQKIIDSWMADGLIGEVSPWNVEISSTEINDLPNHQKEYKVKPNTTTLVDYLLEELNVRLNTKVADIEKSGEQWRLFDFEGGYLGKFDCVIFSTSTSSVYDLIKPSNLLATQLPKIHYSSVWSVVLTFSDHVNLSFDHATFIDSILASCVNTHEKTIVLYATPEWSENFSALSPDQVIEQLKNEFFLLTQLDNTADIKASAKYWPFKAPINTMGEDCIFDETTGFGACGDWCTSPRVEGAVLSGFSIADRVMKYLS